MRWLERALARINPHFSSRKRSKLVDRVAEHFGKQYLKNTVSHEDFQEQKSLESPDSSLNNHINRLDYNKLYFAGRQEVAPGRGDSPGSSERYPLLRDMVSLINTDHEVFKEHFLEEDSDSNRIKNLEENIRRIAKAEPDKEGYFSIPGADGEPIHEREQIGRSKEYKLLKHDYIAEEIDGWAESLHQDSDIEYLLTDHLRTSLPEDGADVSRVKIHLNDERKRKFEEDLKRLLMPRSVAKEYSYALEDTLKDMKKCITGAGKQDGFTKPVAKRILDLVDENYDSNLEAWKGNVMGALTSMEDYNSLNRRFKGLDTAQGILAGSVGMRYNMLEGVDRDRTASSTLVEWAHKYCELKHEHRTHNEFYFGRKRKSGSVKERVEALRDTAINPVDQPGKVGAEYDHNLTHLRGNPRSNQAYENALNGKYTWKARKQVQNEKENIFREMIGMLDPEDRRHLSKTPYEKMDTAITEFWQEDAGEELRKKINEYAAITKLEEFINAAGTDRRIDSLMCGLQDKFSSKYKSSGAWPELYRE